MCIINRRILRVSVELLLFIIFYNILPPLNKQSVPFLDFHEV